MSATTHPNKPQTSPSGSVVWSKLKGLLANEIRIDDVLSAMGEEIAQRLGAEHASVWVLDAGDGMLVNRITDTPVIRAKRMSMEDGIVGYTAKHATVVRLDDALDDSRWSQNLDTITGYQTRSLLSAPIHCGGQSLGVLQAVTSTPGHFTSADEETIVQLSNTLATALSESDLRASPVKPGLHLTGRYNKIVGDSPALQTVYDLIERAAAVDVPVLLTGETGTGKGLFARALHFNSPRRDGPFVCVDCTNLPATLIESTLFGHEKGAFTGAVRRAIGKVEAARGGTLFIDEFGDLPPDVQGKLLRLVQDQEFELVGGNQTKKADVRLVFATHRDLPALVEAGQFRADLYFRAKVVEIELPPLKDRGLDELRRLISHFLNLFGKKYHRPELSLSLEAQHALEGHHWPGNVRELENMLERAVVLCRSQRLECADLGLGQPSSARSALQSIDESESLDDAIFTHVNKVLKNCNGNRSAAARRLKISRNRLARILDDT